ncbi:uncharacterized protein isoform X2 [Rhodnius prolixus]|uniref:uncharacterized protein isoform X2 n=1 Tax=Rhodnius prolixus TaxID=13249 RepID=UPI003D188589
MVAIIEDLVRGVEESGRCPKATARVKQDGGVMFAGVAVATSCQIVLPVFGALFLIVGTVLTIASYRGPEADEDPEQYADRVNLTSNLRILGPCCLAIGICMLFSGIGLCMLSRRNRQNKMTFHCPVHGDFYPLSASSSNLLQTGKRSSLAMCGHLDSVEEMEGLPTPQCPHSNRSSLSTGAQASSPLPPIITSHTSSGFLTPNTLTVGDNTGSTHSLAVSYDVASFPHSRSSSVVSDKDAPADNPH